ncbi:MAG: hypothetical protein ACXAB8_20500 [Promethearchaeota archaeon]|jgi:alpha-L-arabinofuranosidase
MSRALENLTCQIYLTDFDVKLTSGTILTAEILKSYNSFEYPGTIIPREFEVNLSGEMSKITFPKYSLSVLLFE